MRRKRSHDLVRSAVVLCAAAVGPAAAQGGGGSPASFEDAALHGYWESQGGCETQPASGPLPPYFHREYSFEPNETWRMVRTIHADSACGSPLVTLHLAGTYSLGPASEAVTGAREAKLSFDTFHVTLDSAKALPMLAGCGTGLWEVGLEKDVGGTGCLVFKPLAECSVDYDIVQIHDDVLYPGVRTANMCTPAGRPISLQPTGVKRRDR